MANKSSPLFRKSHFRDGLMSFHSLIEPILP